MAVAINEQARALFAPLARDYERWSALLSLGQDPRWRAELVRDLPLAPRARVLDVAAGTGLITRLLEARGCEVVALDQSAEMLSAAHARGADAVLADAVHLPLSDASVDALTFSYLLRYVDDPAACMRELVRVVRPGGAVAMLEFGRPRGVAGPAWWLYTRIGLPVAGSLVGHGWGEVGRFLGPSIDSFHRRFPAGALAGLWREAGLVDVRVRRRSLGGGLLMWGRRP